MLKSEETKMDVFSLLISDHHKARAMFKALMETGEKDAKLRQTLFAELNLELSVHMAAEEKLFYPEIADEHPTHDKTLEAYQEHDVAKTLMKELEADPKDTEEWGAKLKVLNENIEHHVKEEEEDIFPRARKLIPATDALDIADEINEYKETFNLVS